MGLCVLSGVIGCTDLRGRTAGDAGDAGDVGATTDTPGLADTAGPADVSGLADAAPRSSAPACVSGNVPRAVEPWTTSFDILADTPLLRMNVRALSADRAGRVYLAGFFDRAGVGTFRAAVWRFDAEAPTLDGTWGVEGRSLEPEVATPSLVWLGLKLDAEERVVVAGVAESGTSVTTIVERLDTRGVIDPTFGVRGRLVVAPGAWPIATRGFYPYGVALGERGGIAVGGDETITQRPLPRAPGGTGARVQLLSRAFAGARRARSVAGRRRDLGGLRQECRARRRRAISPRRNARPILRDAGHRPRPRGAQLLRV